jgi:LysM repeat protein
MRSRSLQLAFISLLFAVAALLAAGPVQANRLNVGGPGALPQEAITSTPGADGSIVHIVKTDESVASIAETYGISITELRALNSLNGSSTMIFPGQKLIIRVAQPPTETPTFTPTVPRPTRTPTRMIPTRTPRPTATETPTLAPSPTNDPSATALNDFWDANHVYLLYAMIGVCACGLLITLFTGFRKSS